jgi:hypothetical protein
MAESPGGRVRTQAPNAGAHFDHKDDERDKDFPGFSLDPPQQALR